MAPQNPDLMASEPSATANDHTRSKAPSQTPPSSPPLPSDTAETVMMPPPSRKRSHDDFTDQADKAEASSSATMAGDVDPVGSQVKAPDPQSLPSLTILPSTPVHTMTPQQAATSSMLPPPQKPPPSGQGGRRSRSDRPQPPKADKGATAAPTETIDQDDILAPTPSPDDCDSVPSSTPSDPQDRIEDFDWDELHQRYHDQMLAFQADDQAILVEFGSLCQVSLTVSIRELRLTLTQFFSIWASTTSSHEVDRSFKRYVRILRSFSP